MTKDTGGPAFPNEGGSGHLWNDKGMTLRQYAAIKLKVPASDLDWLDEMITKSLRDDFAAKVMQGICAADPSNDFTNERIARESYSTATAMLEARK